tara:strand:+ start:322 stop:483 length:162 start_codon:yes stop_codon:yes gene_type:complete
MNITSARYHGDFSEPSMIIAEIDGNKVYVPLDESNRYYVAIQEWVAEGNTIEE